MSTLSRYLVLSVLSLSLLGSRPVTAADSTPRGVDYVLGMLEAGVPQPAIVARIHDKGLTFAISEGDVDRLRASGAGEDLIRAVTGAQGETVPGAQDRSGRGAEPSSRPRRIDRGSQGSVEPQGDTARQGSVERQGSAEEQAPAEEGDESYQGAPPDDESGADQDSPHGGYPYYRPGEDDGYHGAYAYYGAPYYPPYYDYYPYSFYYSFYYPSYFYYPYGYSYPYRPYIFNRGGFRGHGTRVGPGVPRGSYRGSWSGSSGRPSAPRGSAPHARPRGH